MRINWHRQHKWSGITATFLLLVFCVSGIILNHRDLVADYELSRTWLPSRYEFRNWNGGLMRGTVAHGDSVLIYGVNGIWITDTAATSFRDFNSGLPAGADKRQIRRIVSRTGTLYCVTPYALYRIESGNWVHIPLPDSKEEKFSDIEVNGDTLIVASRSHLYLSTSSTDNFKKLQLRAPEGYEGKVTLFRTVWLLHSGELYGTAGKLVVDTISVIFAFLAITGIVFWLLPKEIRHKVRHHEPVGPLSKLLKLDLHWHDRIGRYTIVLTMILVITGWCLRPPAMIPLVLNKVKAIPGSTLASSNPWHDKLRMIRYDDAHKEWILSTTEGFYNLKELADFIPEHIQHAPSAGVMGLNVWEKDKEGHWLCGSFAGMYRWHRQENSITDYFTGEEAEATGGAPFGKYAVSGYSNEFNTAVEYYDGTDAIDEPDEFTNLPMSLWNIALEAHSGRLFIGSIATFIFIFITGLIIFWSLFSGWKSRKKR